MTGGGGAHSQREREREELVGRIGVSQLEQKATGWVREELGRKRRSSPPEVGGLGGRSMAGSS